MPLVACSKGCGDPVTVDDETFKDAITKGMLDFSHEVCPKDRTTHPTYRVLVTVSRVPHHVYTDELDAGPEAVVIAEFGSKYEAPTFEAAYDDIVREIGKQIERARPMAKLAEEGLGD